MEMMPYYATIMIKAERERERERINRSRKWLTCQSVRSALFLFCKNQKLKLNKTKTKKITLWL